MMHQTILLCMYVGLNSRCSSHSCSWTYLTGRHLHWLFLYAVFLNNCASSMSFSIFTQNDAGQGSGGAVYRCASLLTAAVLDESHPMSAAIVQSDHKRMPSVPQECLQGLHHKLQLH